MIEKNLPQSRQDDLFAKGSKLTDDEQLELLHLISTEKPVAVMPDEPREIRLVTFLNKPDDGQPIESVDEFMARLAAGPRDET